MRLIVRKIGIYLSPKFQANHVCQLLPISESTQEEAVYHLTIFAI